MEKVNVTGKLNYTNSGYLGLTQRIHQVISSYRGLLGSLLLAYLILQPLLFCLLQSHHSHLL